ncbi:MAG: RNA polymerase factor sigma-54 [Candidatus Omnitrophica bacterium]|nr:RNA polymerase factor sigma-54 [Candidatus Omnitrophota bacterium]MDD5672447.1 RNA polymerase factor sigma-54 [Candidatus Omnitrophota bacterium]
MDQRLSQHQAQRQILSPQIRQYLKLLQMPLVELSQAIEAEMAENPVLEESAASRQDDPLPEAEQAEETPVREKSTEELQLGESFEHFEKIEQELGDEYEESPVTHRDIGDVKRRHDYQETLITKPEGLSDFLMWQIRFLSLSETERKIAEEIIGNIDEEGYLKATLEEISAACRVDTPEVAKVLEQIQTLDPPGIGALNLQEALLIQLERKRPDSALALEIVSQHLPLLEKRDWQQLARILSTDVEEVKEAAEMIVRLEPKPGRTFYIEEPIAVTPDGTISFADGEDEEDGKTTEDKNTKFKIEIHDESIPTLRINPYYRKLLRNKNTDEKTKVFLREKIQRAMGFVHALKLRKSTLHEITEEIVKVQPGFFEHGFSHLVPLRLKDIAQKIGIHESTVSRAIQGKYISTPQGTIPYKSFFSTKMETTSGEVESQKSIMEKIRKMIDEEDPQKPLSDQIIVKRLQAEGLVIARRTVAKYRDLLKVLPSHLRRKR